MDAVEKKFGSWENFFNITSGRYRECNHLDKCMLPILDSLNNVGLITVMCCCGHGRGNAYVWFNTGISVESISKLIHNEYIEIKEKKHKRGFKYSSIVFPFRKDVVDYLCSIG